jgi:Icc-related predicted phosphoesterase
MKFACLSDLHGYLPDLSCCVFDALLIGGDICPVSNHSIAFQAEWLDGPFRQWLTALGKPVLAVAGNHDLIFERAEWLVPAGLPWTYLCDSSATFAGLQIYGSPWQPKFGEGWAFNAAEPYLARRWAKIPDATDILLLHGPPHRIGDLSPYDLIHTGSRSLTSRIKAIRPKLVVCGHIHSGRGCYRTGETIVVNAAHVGEDYRPVGPPIVVDVVAKEPGATSLPMDDPT